MFENIIYETQLSGEIANLMFRRISGSDYLGDVSFLTTLRALLASRLKSEDRITLKHCSINLANQSVQKCSEDLAAASSAPYKLIIIDVSGSVDNEEEDLAKFNGIAIPEEYHEFEDVRQFFAQKMNCRAFVNEELKTSVVMVMSMTMRKYHLIQCIIPKLLPWFFANRSISVQERDLLLSLRDKQSTAYCRIIEQISTSDEFKQRKVNSALYAFRIKNLSNQKIRSEQRIASLNRDIDSLNETILRVCRDINNENLKLSGVLTALESNEQSGDDELASFISNNRSVEIIATTETGIRFLIKGHLDVYDPELYRSLARNVDSWYWNVGGILKREFLSRESRKKILDAIFGADPVLKIKTAGIFDVNMDDNSIATANSGHYAPYLSQYYPNPHLYYNRCLGNHRAPINLALNRGDIIGALSQCISSVHSVNVTESASFRHVCIDLFNSDEPILETVDGARTMTTPQAYRYLLEQQSQKPASSATTSSRRI